MIAYPYLSLVMTNFSAVITLDGHTKEATCNFRRSYHSKTITSTAVPEHFSLHGYLDAIDCVLRGSNFVLAWAEVVQ
jgi:hypothetical protein